MNLWTMVPTFKIQFNYATKCKSFNENLTELDHVLESFEGLFNYLKIFRFRDRMMIAIMYLNIYSSFINIGIKFKKKFNYCCSRRI